MSGLLKLALTYGVGWFVVKYIVPALQSTANNMQTTAQRAERKEGLQGWDPKEPNIRRTWLN